MKREQSGPILSAVFVDYDNIYMSLRRKNEEAAKRFAKDAGAWIREIESGRLITATNGPLDERPRRIVMNRCYGNPVPRRNANDSSTDMNSFPFIRHNFLRSGFETVDCPPLTAQLKNSADIRMVMDVRDLLTHDTYFDEFVILSGDADFTPVLHRLRAHARRTVIFANDFTAQPYTAICDGKVQESDLLNLLLEGRLPGQLSDAAPAVLTTSIQHEDIARQIITEVVNAVRSASVPMPLEALADRAIRALGHDRTIGSNWAGTGGFRDLLTRHLPEDVRMTEQPPYLAFEARRSVEAPVPVQRLEVAPAPMPAQAASMQVPSTPPVQLQPAEPRFDRATFFASLPSASMIATAETAGHVQATPQLHLEQAPMAVHIPAAPPVQQRAPVEVYAQQHMAAQAQQVQVSAQIASQAQLQPMRPAFDIPRTPATQSHVAPQNLLPQHADNRPPFNINRRHHNSRRNDLPLSRAPLMPHRCCSSQSRASTKPARLHRCRHLSIACCLNAWRLKLPSKGCWGRKHWSISLAARRPTALNSAAMTCALPSKSSAKLTRGSSRALRQTCSLAASATMWSRAAVARA
jgi:NYN domain